MLVKDYIVLTRASQLNPDDVWFLGDSSKAATLFYGYRYRDDDQKTEQLFRQPAVQMSLTVRRDVRHQHHRRYSH